MHSKHTHNHIQKHTQRTQRQEQIGRAQLSAAACPGGLVQPQPLAIWLLLLPRWLAAVAAASGGAAAAGRS